MNDDFLISGVNRSNVSKSGISNSSHRRRFHNQDSHHSSDIGTVINIESEEHAGSEISEGLQEHSKRFQGYDNDDGLYSGLLGGHRGKLPASTSLSGTTTSKFNNTNHTLTFHMDSQNNNSSSRYNNGFKLPYYSNYNTCCNNTNISNDYEYQQNQNIPFNTDRESGFPHYDAEFFPEASPTSNSHQNKTSSNVPSITLDPFLSTLGSLSEDSASSHYPYLLSNSEGSFNNNYLFNKTVANVLFAQNGIFSEYDNIVPSGNFSANIDSGYNTSSSSHGVGSSDYDIYTWSILIMAPLVIFGITGNTLVILAISLEKRLQNVTNYFLLSLAVTDLLVSLIVMPFSIINVLTGRWMFGLLLCDFFVTSDVLMCTSSILHLCTISLERYIGIRYPLWTKNKSKRIVLLKIVLVWTIAFAISSPITILGVVKEDNVLVGGTCVLNNEYFIIYGSLFAFYIPLAIMVLMYALTVRMLNKQARLCHSRPAEQGEGQPMIRRSTSRRNWQTRRKFYGREALSDNSYCGTQLVEGGITGVLAPFQQRYRTTGVKRNNTIPMCYHHSNHHTDVGDTTSNTANMNLASSIQRMGSHNSAAVVNNNNKNKNSNTYINSNGRRNRFGNQNGSDSTLYRGLKQVAELSYCNGRPEKISTDPPSDPQNSSISRLSSSSSSPSPTSAAKPKRLRDLVRKHHVAVKAANILLMKRDSPVQGQNSALTPSSNSASVRRDNSVRTEQKASKVLGVVFMIFVVCWAPFFTVNILTAVCTSCKFEPTLITAFVWLGYVSSTLNPIIYTIFNNIFRITFIKLICCRYHLLHRARRNSNLPGIRNGLLNCTAFCPAPLTATATMNTTCTFLEESQC